MVELTMFVLLIRSLIITFPGDDGGEDGQPSLETLMVHG
jgi:hypothetical protein